VYRRPVAVGGGVAVLAGIATWFVVAWFIGQLGGGGLIVMNWFSHKIYRTGWISHHHKRRRGLLSANPETKKRRTLRGLALLGFTSVYRERFEVVIFLQQLRELCSATGRRHLIALTLVIGSYVAAQYLRVWRPRRRGKQAARMSAEIPELPADVAVAAPSVAAPASLSVPVA
jgi:high-affinity Fe2+/Pb2+ permease